MAFLAEPSVLRHCDAYVQFRASVPKTRVCVGHKQKEWVMFQCGDRNQIPLVMLHGTSGAADVFFFQLLALSAKGYHVISLQYPPFWSHTEFVKGFHQLLRDMNIRDFHLFGCSLGAFLALKYTIEHPTHVLSLMLCNGFSDTIQFASNASCVRLLHLAPEFYLRGIIFDSFPCGALEPCIADAVDFCVESVDALTKNDLAARLTLNGTKARVTSLGDYKANRITVIDSVDEVSLPKGMRARMYNLLEGAKFAFLKAGGDFPFLAVPDEVTMHIQVHLRHHGLFPDLHVRRAVVEKRSAEEEKEAPQDGAEEETEAHAEEEVHAEKEEEEEVQAEKEAIDAEVKEDVPSAKGTSEPEEEEEEKENAIGKSAPQTDSE